ncbi:hypothetical protein GCK72_015084 [Caenorhabditis remanei]|uniref:Uncharacterized protein n=1 Tax=Caenorhabditis remanei TaxID=31234 RepID=A0A6A5GVS8_CAERE|nr:hypothetical protein GCK72_015084 [Caenorhabditis remanei]KAF1758625.1 hypothetical protein GCK72_015084 [Caenorhabditis remanei]
MIYRFLNIGMMSKKKRRDIPYYAGYLKIVLLGSMTFSLVLMPMTYYLDLSVPSHYQLYKYIIYVFVIFLGYFTWNVVDACELQYSWAYSVLLPCLAVFHYYLPNYMVVNELVRISQECKYDGGECLKSFQSPRSLLIHFKPTYMKKDRNPWTVIVNMYQTEADYQFLWNMKPTVATAEESIISCGVKMAK